MDPPVDFVDNPILLHSRDHSELLDAIDLLRSLGISPFVPLPQLIVCGDQSSGKSSVLDAVSGVRFPAKDNLCTRFATELILRRGLSPSITANIIPGSSRTAEQRVKLAKIALTAKGVEDVPELIESAKNAMDLDVGLGAFSDDVLRVEITGPKQSHMTLVDLPGLIHAENKQQSAQDVDIVHNLVRTYMASSRSIILAVVSAKNDYANQIVTKLARKVDPTGVRTLGIITKPDTLHEGSESEKSFVNLARNEDVVFRLGWHVLKNRDFTERSSTLEERDESEAQFFSKGIWASLPNNCLGVARLKPRLSCLLRDQIVTELPSLIHEIEQEVDGCRTRLKRLGESRGTLREQRTYLLRIGQSFCSLVDAASNGNYVPEYFGSASTKVGEGKRLRAAVQSILLDFSEEMRLNGHARKIVDGNPVEKEYQEGGQVTRSAFLKEVKVLMRKTRGRELPGTFNPLIIGDLFFEQAQPWEELARGYAQRIVDAVNLSLRLVMAHVVDESTGAGLERVIVDPAVERCKTALQQKLVEIMRPHQKGHPITYNHYFTETVQKARRQHEEERLKARINVFFKLKPDMGNSYLQRQEFTTGALLEALTKTNEEDMELFSCSEAVYCMEAYYKVAMKVVVDNFAVLAIETCLLEPLVSILGPEVVMNLANETVQEIASESGEIQNERSRILSQLENFEKALGRLSHICRLRVGEHDLAKLSEVFLDSRSEDDDDEAFHKLGRENSADSSSTTAEAIDGVNAEEGTLPSEDIQEIAIEPSSEGDPWSAFGLKKKPVQKSKRNF